MSFLQTLLSLPESVITVGLLLGIVVAVVLAFKVLEMVFETVTIAVLSGVFYIAMTYFFQAPFSINDLLLFSFLGASLYMLYNVLMTAFKTAETVLKVPLTILGWIYSPVKRYSIRLYREIKRRIKRRNEEEVNEKSTKEVVLDN